MSRPQVTITLGRSGQVVKRPASVPDDGPSDYMPPARGKRSIRDRLGSNADNSFLYERQLKNKRQRRDSNGWSPSNDDVDDVRVGRDDLRFKLIRKSMSRRTRSGGEKQNNMDLRENPSRTEHRAMAIHTRQRMSEPKDTSLLRRIPPTKSADDLLHMDSVRKSYSSLASGGFRHRSPDRISGISRGLSPPRNIEERRQVPSIRSVDASRPPYMSKDLLHTSRVTGPTSYMSKAGVSLEPAKPITRLPPPSGMVHKNSYMGEESRTVGKLLQSLGLGKYAIVFQAEEVDMTALKQMGDDDLKALGIPMGPRKKILLAVLPRSKPKS